MFFCLVTFVFGHLGLFWEVCVFAYPSAERSWSGKLGAEGSRSGVTTWGPQVPFAFLPQMCRAVGTIWLTCLQLEREKHMGSAAAQEEAECDGIDDDHHMKEVGLGMNQNVSN